MPLSVVRAALGQSGLHGQCRRGPVQRLDLGLLVHTQHDRVLRRVQVKPDDVGDLGGQLEADRERERLRLPRLHSVLSPGPGTVSSPDPQMNARQPDDERVTPQLLRRRRQRRGDDGPVILPSRPFSFFEACR